MPKLIITFFAILFCTHSFAQDSLAKTQFVLGKIFIEGNKKTKNYFIKREIGFEEGDSVSTTNISDWTKDINSRIYNLGLFSETNVDTIMNNGSSDLKISVREKWYLYVLPQFQLVDRNFNEWWNNQNHSFKRVNYGLKINHYNLSGRKDVLRLILTTGYSQNILLSYAAPASGKTLNNGFSAMTSYSRAKETNFKTSTNNKNLYYTSPDLSKQSLVLQANYLMRKGLYERFVVGLAFTHLKISDSISNFFNPDYFNSGKNQTSFIDIQAGWSYSKLDKYSYPLKGFSSSAYITKRGFEWKNNNSALFTTAGANYFLPHGKGWYSSFHTNGRLVLPFDQPFINRKAIGYRDMNLRGLEYYVIDGVASIIGSYNLKKQILNLDLPSPIQLRTVSKIPVLLMAKIYSDVGYSYIDKKWDTKLNNRFLYTYGFGVDLATVYDTVIRFEYSFNQLNEKGLFLGMKTSF